MYIVYALIFVEVYRWESLEVKVEKFWKLAKKSAGFKSPSKEKV